MQDLIITQRLIEKFNAVDALAEVTARHVRDAMCGEAVGIFSADNGGLLATGGATSFSTVKSCKEFELEHLVRGHMGGRPTIIKGGSYPFDHMTYFKRGRTPIAIASCIHRPTAAEISGDGWRSVNTGLPGWYEDQLGTELVFVLAEGTRLRIEEPALA